MAGVRILLQYSAASAEQAEKDIQSRVARCPEVAAEPGCEQFEVFRSALHPERYVLVEHWASEQALADHHKLRGNPPPPAPGITRTREIYEQKSS